MKNQLSTFTIVCFATLWLAQGAEDDRKGIWPVEPQLLLNSMPKQVDGFALKKSRGWMGLGTWLESVATREFHQIIPPDDKSKKPPAITRLNLQDTAKFKGGDIDLFANFDPNNSPAEGIEYKLINGNPTIISISKGKPKMYVQMLIHERFILSLQLRNQTRKDVGKWMRMISTTKLSQIQDGPIKPIPSTFTSISINELDPKKNVRTLASVGDSDFVEEDADDGTEDPDGNEDEDEDDE